MATIGNKKSVFTGLITHRSGNEERTRLIAEEAKTYVECQLAREVWQLLGHEEASLVLAPELIQKVGMMDFSIDTDEEDDVDDLIATFTINVNTDNDDLPRTSAWGGGAVVTTQSTSDRLTTAEAQQAANDTILLQKDAEFQQLEVACQAEQAEREAAKQRVTAQNLLLQQQTKTIEALMRQLAEARTTETSPPSPTYFPLCLKPLPTIPTSIAKKWNTTRTTPPALAAL